MGEDKLRELLAVYRSTLQFYANEETYLEDKWGSPIERDFGENARKVLSEETGSEFNFVYVNQKTFERLSVLAGGVDVFNLRVDDSIPDGVCKSVNERTIKLNFE